MTNSNQTNDAAPSPGQADNDPSAAAQQMIDNFTKYRHGFQMANVDALHAQYPDTFFDLPELALRNALYPGCFAKVFFVGKCSIEGMWLSIESTDPSGIYFGRLLCLPLEGSTGLFYGSPVIFAPAHIAEVQTPGRKWIRSLDELPPPLKTPTVSTKKLYAAYEDFCGLKGWASLAEREFQLKLPHLMKTLLGVVGSHSLAREFKHTRGYRGVRLADGQAGDAP